MDTELTKYLLVAGLTVIVTVLTLTFVVPDAPARWLVSRRNGPTILVVPGLILLTVAGFNLIIGVGGSFVEAVRSTTFEWWVWATLVLGAIMVVIYLISRRRSRRTI